MKSSPAKTVYPASPIRSALAATSAPTAASLRRIIFSKGGKGGVGKTFACALLGDWLLAQGARVSFYDCDEENRSLSRFFPQACPIAVRDKHALDAMIEQAVAPAPADDLEPPASPAPSAAAAAPGGAVVIADLKAGTRVEMARYFAEVPAALIREELGVEFTALGVLTADEDSAETLLKWAEMLGEHVRYLLVVNEAFGPVRLDWPPLRLFLDDQRPALWRLPALDAHLAEAMRRAGVRLSQAALDASLPALTRLRFRRYRDEVWSQLDALRAQLLPAELTGAEVDAAAAEPTATA